MILYKASDWGSVGADWGLNVTAIVQWQPSRNKFVKTKSSWSFQGNLPISVGTCFSGPKKPMANIIKSADHQIPLAGREVDVVVICKQFQQLKTFTILSHCFVNLQASLKLK